MSRIYDNWEKLVGAVLKREEFRRLAHCESFSTSISSDFSARPSFDSDVPHDSRNPGETSDQVPSSWESIFVSRNIKFIQYEEIKLGTQNFQPDMLLGEGRFGSVFKGWIHEHLLTAVKPGSGVAVAFKKLNKREIFCLNQSHHPNLVKLIGYSFEEGNRVLAYEFMANGSLDNHLFTRGHQLLSWETRVKVATGAARGLSFFHDLAIIVGHGGLKSSSILLDDEFNAKLSDLDLRIFSRLAHLSTPVRNGYAAPEYLPSGTGRLTMKSDVYSFGIILLELLTGLRVFDENRPMKEQNLIAWTKRYLSNRKKLLQIVDSRLESQYPREGAYKFGKLALQCLSLDPKLRPRMAGVIDMLEQLSVGPIELSTGVDRQMDQAGSWSVLPSGDASKMKNQKTMKKVRFADDVAELRRGSTNHDRLLQKKIDYLVQLRHPNLVNLVAYCTEEANMMLVDEFMPNGSLSDHLFTTQNQSLPWTRRLKVALDVARGLCYLHDTDIIHRDFKPANIFLDWELNAKLSNYTYDTDDPTHQEFVAHGYTAPEYTSKGHLTTKSNVYTFGVVLLELLSGTLASNLNLEKSYFGTKSRLLQIIDVRLGGQYSRDAAYEVVKLALKCLNRDPKARPRMADVVVALQQFQGHEPV